MSHFDPVDLSAGESFAWCLSHGRLHRFTATPWCTATWSRLDGNNERDALLSKSQRFGDAVFLHALSLEAQASLTGDRP